MVTKNRIDPCDFVGKKFGRYEILRFYGFTKSKNRLWWCCCECGVEKVVGHSPLVLGKVVSCGCYNQKRRAKLGGLQKMYPREYKCWHAMIQRCRNPHYGNYTLYGARGITVVDEWVGEKGFASFIDHIGPCPSSSLTLDRIDNDGNYEPGNVRWADNYTQSNNRRGNHKLSLNGKTQGIREWSRELGINEQTLHERLRRGWSIERTLLTPLERRK